MSINDPISYQWRWGWKEMADSKPMVNRLIKAMLEKNVFEMERLFSIGATLKGCNKSTFGRTLFMVIDDYSLVKCLVKHGFTAIYTDGNYMNSQCYDSNGYCWGYIARAWSLKAFDVVELLAQNGFEDLTIHFINNTDYTDLDEVIFLYNDVRTAKILLENGYPRRTMEKLSEKYPESKVSKYLIDNPVIHRKTICLSGCKYGNYPKPKLEKGNIFNKKKIEEHNKELMADYDDFIMAQNRFIDFIGKERWIRIAEELEKNRNETADFLWDMVNTHPELFE